MTAFDALSKICKTSNHFYKLFSIVKVSRSAYRQIMLAKIRFVNETDSVSHSLLVMNFGGVLKRSIHKTDGYCTFAKSCKIF